MKNLCPHCGANLPEKADFCPYCAQNLRSRKQVKSPVPRRKKVLVGLLVLVLGAAAALGGFFALRPEVFDGMGEILYTAKGGTVYQILVAWPGNRCQPAPEIYQSGRAEDVTRWPSRLYVNYKDTGADGWEEFSQLVEAVEVQVEQDPEGASSLTAEEPVVRDSYSPDAAMVSVLEFTGDCGNPRVVWTLHMKNGDRIQVRQTMNVTLIHTYRYDYREYPMETMEQLQSLLEQIEEETDRQDEVLVYLPPVTYTGKLKLEGRSYSFYGCTDGTERTAFTDTVQVATQKAYWITYFYDIDFVGSGGGVGISASESCRAERCRFTDWRTGVLGYGEAWVSVDTCEFTGNQIGFHFNSTGQSANDSLYQNNVFRNNGTAVRLENVPTDMEITFAGSVFSGNGKDLENLCGHPADVSKAVFEDKDPA